MAKPQSGSYPAMFDNYIKLVSEEDAIAALQNQENIISDFFPGIQPERADYAYAPGKWTLKEMLQHIIDAERVFNYRALAIARGETQSLPGFDENLYAANSFGIKREWQDLCNEFRCLRESTIYMFKGFDPTVFSNSGISNNNRITVDALAFITVGHVYHHRNIIEERYVAEVPL
jgi:hypothetical protein